MLVKENYTADNIFRLQSETETDPSIIERTIFAFGLLEAIRSVDMPFIFKGGTSLMLLLNNPCRLSTDIDIIVHPDTDVDEYIKQAIMCQGLPFTVSLVNQSDDYFYSKSNTDHLDHSLAQLKNAKTHELMEIPEDE